MILTINRDNLLLELSRAAKRGELLEVRWYAKGRHSITIVEVCWCQSIRKSHAAPITWVVAASFRQIWQVAY